MTRKRDARLMMIVGSVVLLVIGGVGAAEGDQAKLQGLWRVKGFAGQKAPSDEDRQAAFRMIIDIQGNNVTLLWAVIDDKRIKKWSLRVMPNERPKQFELTREGPPLLEQPRWLPDTLGGTYELADDTLRIGVADQMARFLRKFLSGAGQAQTRIVELERIDEEYVQALSALQGLWKLTEPKTVEGRIVLVEGEWIRGTGSDKNMAIRFRLGPTEQPKSPDAPAPGSTVMRQITFFLLERVDAFLLTRDDGRVRIVAGLGSVGGERATTEDLAANELKPVMSRRSLAEKKQALEKFIAQYPGTGAAETARQELERMPTDEGIREINAAEMLKTAKEHLRAEYLTAAKGTFQGVIDDYPGTQAAETARQELERMPTEAEIREIEAARELRSAKFQLESCYDRKQKLTEASRGRVKASAEQRLRRLITYYPGTKAAAEAQRLLDPAIQREKQAAELLRLAKMLLSEDPQAAKRRLRELVTEFADTKAVEEAQRLLGQAE